MAVPGIHAYAAIGCHHHYLLDHSERDLRGLRTCKSQNRQRLLSYLSFLMLGWCLSSAAPASSPNYFTDSVGMLLMHLRMLFYTDAIGKGGSRRTDVFYWAWWVIYAIQIVSSARISRGRTVRGVLRDGDGSDRVCGSCGQCWAATRCCDG